MKIRFWPHWLLDHPSLPQKITGNLVVSTTKASTVSLAALEAVGGSIEITGNVMLDAMCMPAFGSVDGSLVIQRNPRLGASQPDGDSERVVSVAMPMLDRIGGAFKLEENTRLTSLTLERLRSVGRGVNILSNSAMWRAALNSLGTVRLACRNHHVERFSPVGMSARRRSLSGSEASLSRLGHLQDAMAILLRLHRGWAPVTTRLVDCNI